MPSDRRSPHTTSASGCPDTTVRTTPSSASAPIPAKATNRRVARLGRPPRAERAQSRKAVLTVEQVAEEERHADVAREERVAAPAEDGALALDLADRVHREGAG